jgi:hypothetical protein
MLFDVMLLIEKHEFESRENLWNETPPSKYEGALQFGWRGMSKT